MLVALFGGLIIKSLLQLVDRVIFKQTLIHKQLAYSGRRLLAYHEGAPKIHAPHYKLI